MGQNSSKAAVAGVSCQNFSIGRVQVRYDKHFHQPILEVVKLLLLVL